MIPTPKKLDKKHIYLKGNFSPFMSLIIQTILYHLWQTFYFPLQITNLTKMHLLTHLKENITNLNIAITNYESNKNVSFDVKRISDEIVF